MILAGRHAVIVAHLLELILLEASKHSCIMKLLFALGLRPVHLMGLEDWSPVAHATMQCIRRCLGCQVILALRRFPEAAAIALPALSGPGF